MLKKGKFDYILLETTGLADPGNIHTFTYIIEPLHQKINNLHMQNQRCRSAVQ